MTIFEIAVLALLGALVAVIWEFARSVFGVLKNIEGILKDEAFFKLHPDYRNRITRIQAEQIANGMNDKSFLRPEQTASAWADERIVEWESGSKLTPTSSPQRPAPHQP